MSWFVETPLTYLQKFAINVMKCGKIPRHIAIIMDGNRRYAQKLNKSKSEGHQKGFNTLAETLQWCKELGIIEVTVYAFSIENFKRSKEEVDTLMGLATEKFAKLLEESDKLMAEGVCIRVIGNLALLSTELKQLIAKVMLLTRDNKKLFFNIAFAYTSHEELTNTANILIEAINNNEIETNDLSEELISKCLYTGLSTNPEILIRTSGEVRFSDFLLWQIKDSFIWFADVLWPEFCLWHLLATIFQYQRFCYDNNKGAIGAETVPVKSCGLKVDNFLHNLHERQWRQLQSYVIEM